MGFFDELKNAASSVKSGFEELGAQQREQAEAARNAPVEIIDPTPQDEIDRMNAESGPGRGVLIGSQDTLESGESVMRAQATLWVRARLAGGELGPTTQTKVWMNSKTIRGLRRGQEVPILFDRITGNVMSVDAKGVMAEFKKG
jgi:hypothetical protein